MLRKIRIILAAVMFTCITLLFLDFTGTAHAWLGWMARVQFLPAVLALNVLVVIGLLLLTFIFGRVYCSVICPLGIMQDLMARLNRKRNKYSFSKAIKWLRLTVLGVFVVALVAGVGSVVQLLAPYSAFGRIATMLLQPLWKLGNNALATLAERTDSYAFYTVDVAIPGWGVVLGVAVVTFMAVSVLAFLHGRTYCNTICPVGTVLSFVARYSWLKVRFVEDKCRNCSMCSRNCKASCIDYKTQTVDYSRCVACGNCIEHCKFGALKYSAASVKSGSAVAPDAGKRSFLIASALASTAALAQKKDKVVDGGLAELEAKVAPERQTLLTPPGSLSAQNMATRCTGCQLCVSECPNRVLRPSTDLMHFAQPVMSYESGYCRPECTRCSDVCPTGAIRPLDDIEKSSIQIGHAVWIRKNCIPLTDGVPCGNCARHCPAGAIEMVPSAPDDPDSLEIPAVNEQACIGCGACEYVCPARPFSAIIVEGHDVHHNI